MVALRRARYRTPFAGFLLVFAGVLIGCSTPAASTQPSSAATQAATPQSSTPQSSATAAASASAAASVGAPAEITFGAFVTPNLPKEFWTEMAAKFTAKNPNIKVNVLFPPASEADVSGYYKTLLASGKMPDVVSNIIDADFIKAGALAAYDTNDPEVQQLVNLNELLVGGKLYTLASVIQPLSLIYYNKDLLTKAGVTTIPTTLAELETAMAALKTAGITPMLTAGDQLAYIQWNSFTSADVFGQNPTWFSDRRAGKVHFAEGANLSWAQRISDWAKKGYFPDGATGLTYEQVTQDFLDGKGAMIANGIWYAASIAGATTTFESGLFPAPTEDGQKRMATVQSGFCFTSAKSASLEAAIKLCKFISFDADGHGAILTKDSGLSSMKTPPAVQMVPLQQAAADLLKNGYAITKITNGLGDELPVADMFGEITASWQALLLGQDGKKVMTDLDAWWDQKQQAGG